MQFCDKLIKSLIRAVLQADVYVWNKLMTCLKKKYTTIDMTFSFYKNSFLTSPTLSCLRLKH